MPIERKPLKPVRRGYIPSDFKPYIVKNGDTWQSIAKSHRMDVWELMHENFKTSDVSEINWYLKNYVGCVDTTADMDNWVFSNKAKPGRIYVPSPDNVIPIVKKSTIAEPALKKVWAGIAKAHSADLFILGAHDLTGMVYNLGDKLPDVRNATLNINGFKIGPGLGGSIGAVFVIAHGYNSPAEMTGGTESWDFDLAIAGKLDSFLKGARGIGKVVDTIQKYKKMRYLTENVIKNLGITEKGIYTIPIPFAGVGIHAWAGFKFGTVSIFRQGKGIF